MMAELKKASVKSKVEAVLFSTGQKISLDEISRLCRSRKEEVLAALQELRKDYDDKQSSMMLVEDGDFWKLNVRDYLIPIVRKIVTETELTKSVLETLAVIAFKYPILQSDLIKIRTNKAYDHLTELELAGYISRQKHGRTNLIKLTDKFFKYFDLTEENLREQFKDFGSIAKAIKDKEEEVEKIKEDQKKKAEDLKKEDERIKKEIDSLDKIGDEFNVPLETYKSKPNELVSEEFVNEQNLIIEKEKIGSLEVIEEEQKKKPRAAAKTEAKEEPKDVAEELQSPNEPEAQELLDEDKMKNAEKRHRKGKGIQLTPDMEAKVDEKVEEMIHGEPESKEEKNLKFKQ